MATCKDCLFKCYTDDADRVEETCNFFLPTNKYAEVVRCKDCKEFHRADDRLEQHCRTYGAMVGEDDFCSYGERKDNERKAD